MTSILVIDDSQSNAQLLKIALESRGYEVVCAYTGQSALEIAVELHPAIIITDLRLPGSSLDGWTVIERFRDMPEFEHTPIIVTSVEVSPEDRLRAFDAGCDEYIPKPFKINEFRSVIEKYT